MEAGAKVRSVSEILGPDIERYREILKNDPNQVYARDAAVTLPWDPHVFLPCRMGRPIRVPEETVMRAVLEKL